ncbi:hypothetical protein BASA82_000240 [Batrachochytrium salamandrivorans]|nr:hypothetical protein BASA82_000240 [Batrachochytrium salamandrivorans]
MESKPASSPRTTQLEAEGEEEQLLTRDDEAAGWFPSSIKQHSSDKHLPLPSAAAGSLPLAAASGSTSKDTNILFSPAFVALMTYSLISTSMVLSNKLVLSTYDFQFPMVLLFHQTLMTVNCLHIAKQLEWITYEPLNRKQVLQWLPLDVFFVTMLFTGFLSMTYLSIPMVTIFKNTNNLFIALGDGLLFRNFPTRGVSISLLLMVAAAVMAGLNDLEFSVVGYAWTLANCLSSSGYVLYAQFVLRHTTLSTFGKVYYNNVLALPLVLLLDFFVFGDFMRLLTYPDLHKFFEWDFVFLWGWSGVLGILQSFCALKAQHLSSPTTYSMVGSLNKIPMTFLGIAVFHTAMTNKGLVYTALSILAGALYSYVKAKEELEARANKPTVEARPSANSMDQQKTPTSTTTHHRRVTASSSNTGDE